MSINSVAAQTSTPIATPVRKVEASETQSAQSETRNTAETTTSTRTEDSTRAPQTTNLQGQVIGQRLNEKA